MTTLFIYPVAYAVTCCIYISIMLQVAGSFSSIQALYE
jgi:hypothetical protein